MDLRLYNQLQQIVPQVRIHYFRLVYVYEYKRGATVQRYSSQNNIPYVNVNLEIAKKLQEVPTNRRIYKISDLFDEVINSYHGDIVCLDYIELLFNPAFSINAFELFKNASRNKTLVIAWRGTITERHLIFGEPGHPEHIKFPIQDVTIIR